jgi:hypothetical protein
MILFTIQCCYLSGVITINLYLFLLLLVVVFIYNNNILFNSSEGLLLCQSGGEGNSQELSPAAGENPADTGQEHSSTAAGVTPAEPELTSEASITEVLPEAAPEVVEGEVGDLQELPQGPDFNGLEITDKPDSKPKSKSSLGSDLFSPQALSEMFKRGLIKFNVKSFPYVIIYHYGGLTIILDFAEIISSLSRSMRRKLAALCNKKFTAAADIHEIPGSGDSELPAETAETGSPSTSTEASVQTSPSQIAPAEKRLHKLLGLLGLPLTLSNSQMKWVFNSKSWTAEHKAELKARLADYKNSPRNKTGE